MILQALAAYYDRLLTNDAVQAQGFQEKEIPWVVELSLDGRFLRLIRTGDEDGRGRKFVVPAEVKKSVNIAANLLWDNPEYVFGWPRPGLTEKQAAKVPKRHEGFMARLRELPEAVRTDPGVSAVIKFLENDDFAALQSADGWQELRRGNASVSFRLSGDPGLVCERPAVRAALSQSVSKADDMERQGWCLVTGRRAGSTRLHASIKGVRGAQTSGANLVSFNLDAFTSHGWSQGANAPISEAAAHAYTAALNHLLARGNERHRLTEGDTTFVFWAAAATAIVDHFAYLLGSYVADQQESDGTPVRETFESARRGLKPSLDDETPFYVLGLAPNAARLAVRFWHEGTVADMAHNILRHFDDLEVVGLGGESNVPKLWRLIAASARKGEPKNLQDNLRGQLFAGLMTSILDGLPYPGTLLSRTVARCRAECPTLNESFIRFHRPSIGEEEIVEVVETLKSGWLTTGPRVARFEREFCERTGASHAIAVNSATAGLHLALAALEIGPGDEVITTPMTFCATVQAILHVGATPVLADIGLDGNIDPDQIEKRITGRTRALIPVHLAGLPCKMEAIWALARKRGLHVIEDAAHAAGAFYDDRPIGAGPDGSSSASDAVVFSFYATKNLTTGEGGMITTHRPALAETMRMLSLHGVSHDAWDRYSDRGDWRYDVLAHGFKYNMSDIQAAIGIHQLRKLNQFIERRTLLASMYDQAFAGMDELEPPPDNLRCRHAWHLYILRLNLQTLTIDRAEFIRQLKQRGIGASVHFIPIPMLRYFSQLPVAQYPVPCALDLYTRIVSLPLYPAMTEDQVQYVGRSVREIVESSRTVRVVAPGPRSAVFPARSSKATDSPGSYL